MTNISVTAPPVTRAVAVLNFLAGHPDQAFTLTELAKALRISSATLHDLLAALTGSGYIYRTIGKTYVLGPALARIAHASMSPALIEQVARPEMRVLADDFDLVCIAYHLEGDRLVERERASSLSHIDWNLSSQTNMPTTAPVGGIFKAWGKAELENWIATAEPPLAAQDKETLYASLGFLQTRGFAFAVQSDSGAGSELARDPANSQSSNYDVASSIESETIYRPIYVSAPIFSGRDQVAFALSLVGFVAPITGTEIEFMGNRLRAACDRIGAFIAGRGRS